MGNSMKAGISLVDLGSLYLIPCSIERDLSGRQASIITSMVAYNITYKISRTINTHFYLPFDSKTLDIGGESQDGRTSHLHILHQPTCHRFILF